MKDEEIGGLLTLAFLSKNSAEYDDRLVDAILDRSDVDSANKESRLKQNFIKALSAKRRPTPLRFLDLKTTFATWISKERQALGIELKDFADVLAMTSRQLEGLEKNQIKPWELTATAFLQIMATLRVHYDGVVSLVRTTASVSQMSGINAAQARCHSGKMTTARGDATAQALELFKAHNADPVRDSQAEDWLKTLKQYLEHDENNDLIS